MDLLVRGVDETAVVILGTVVAVVMGSRISNGDTATDDVTIELLFGVEWTMVETVEPILEKGDAAAEMFLGVAWWPTLAMLKLPLDAAWERTVEPDVLFVPDKVADVGMLGLLLGAAVTATLGL